MKKEIKLEDIFNDEKRQGVKELIDTHKQRPEKYSERFDNDKSEIGNPDTWGKRVVEELKQTDENGKPITYWGGLAKPKQETLEEVSTKEGLFRASQHNFNQAEAGYNAKWFKRGALFGAKWQAEQNDASKVTRVEVIQHSFPYNGRAYTNYFAKDVEIQFQDDGKTLKIFLK